MSPADGSAADLGAPPPMLDTEQQRQITMRYLEFLTRSLRQAERRHREAGDQQGAHSAAVWAERAHELRRHLTVITHARP